MNYFVKVQSRIRYTFLIALIFLSGCSLPPSPREKSFLHVASIEIQSSDHQHDIEKRYGGKAIVFKPEAGFAILGFAESPLSTLTTSTNQGVYQITALGNRIWASGKHAWGGGLKTWAGGKHAWGGGSSNVPTLPHENRALWRELKLPQAQALSKNFGYGAKIAVIDTGIDLNHPAFINSLAPQNEWKDFIDNDSYPQEVQGAYYGHGTAVAGIVLQIAPRATILPLRVLNSDGAGDVDDVVAAIDWAVQKGAKIINLSLGSIEAVSALDSMVSYAANQGVYVIASAGNAGTSNLTFPAAQAATGTTNGSNILSVGSATIAGVRSSFSNYGTALEYLSFGENVYSAYPDNQVGYFTGTSFAAPQITGCLALIMMDTDPANRTQMETKLRQGIWNIGGTGNGYGIPNTIEFIKQLPGYTAKKALLVVGDTMLSSSDTRLRNRLSYIGYSVTVVSHDTVTATHTTNQHVVVISESVNPTTVNTKLRNVAVPIVVLEPLLFASMSMVSSSSMSGFQSTQTHLDITDATHPLAAGYTNTQRVYTSSDNLSWGTPTNSAIKAASVSGNTMRSVIFGYNQDAAMANMNAPARRVGLYLSGTGADKWASPGSMLFDAAVTWALTGN